MKFGLISLKSASQQSRQFSHSVQFVCCCSLLLIASLRQTIRNQQTNQQTKLNLAEWLSLFDWFTVMITEFMFISSNPSGTIQFNCRFKLVLARSLNENCRLKWIECRIGLFGWISWWIAHSDDRNFIQISIWIYFWLRMKQPIS